MTFPELRRFVPLVVLSSALPAMAASNCGLALDYTETMLITDPVERIVIVTDDGNVDAVAYERGAILLKRHTFGFENQLGEPEFGVDDGVLRFEVHCKNVGKCSFDHLFELPLGIGFDITMADTRIDLGYIDGDITAEFETGRFKGVRLLSPRVEIVADSAEVRIDFAAPPELLTVDLAEGEVNLEVPVGEYRCEFEATTSVVPDGIVCNDTAAAVLDVFVGEGSIVVTGREP